MIEYRTLRTASRSAADHHCNLILGPRGPLWMNDFEVPQGSATPERRPRVTVISGSGPYDDEPTTIDVGDYTEIKAPAATVRKTDPFLSAVAGPTLVFVAALLVAIMISLMPASDSPIFLDGPLAGQSLLHFPR